MTLNLNFKEIEIDHAFMLKRKQLVIKMIRVIGATFILSLLSLFITMPIKDVKT